MNKKIKRVVALALTISAFSAIAPATNFNLMTTKAYATRHKDDDEKEFSKVYLKTSGGSSIQLYNDDDYKRDQKADNNEITPGTYYAKTSSNKVKFRFEEGPSSSRVKIFKGTSKSARGVSGNSSISLSSGTNIITVRIYSESQESTVKYKDDDNIAHEYRFEIKCTGNSSDDNDDEKGDVYLRNISLSEGNINFSEKTSTYNVNVATSVDEIKITAKPDCSRSDYDDYEVRIDGKEVEDNDDFKKTVSLNKGKNEIKVSVEKKDNDEKRTYTLNINRGGTTTTNAESTTTTDVKCNQWVNVNGKLQYNDSLGHALKNTWFSDPSNGSYYYLDANGYKTIGWLLNGGKWYYLDENGLMKTGWQSINGAWYILDGSGAMLTGWYKDMNGTWYYLQSSGAMKTGWLLDGSKWYFLNGNGSMAANTTIGGYRLGSNGAWVR